MKVGKIVRIPERKSASLSEKKKGRPGVVVALKSHDNAVVVPLTKRIPTLPTHVDTKFNDITGIASCEHPMSFHINALIDAYDEEIEIPTLRKIERAFRIAVGIIPTRQPPNTPRFFRGCLVKFDELRWLVISNNLGNYYGNTLIISNPDGLLMTIDSAKVQFAGRLKTFPTFIEEFYG